MNQQQIDDIKYRYQSNDVVFGFCWLDEESSIFNQEMSFFARITNERKIMFKTRYCIDASGEITIDIELSNRSYIHTNGINFSKANVAEIDLLSGTKVDFTLEKFIKAMKFLCECVKTTILEVEATAWKVNMLFQTIHSLKKEVSIVIYSTNLQDSLHGFFNKSYPKLHIPIIIYVHTPNTSDLNKKMIKSNMRAISHRMSVFLPNDFNVKIDDDSDIIVSKEFAYDAL